jgi:hypothetical protein
MKRSHASVVLAVLAIALCACAAQLGASSSPAADPTPSVDPSPSEAIPDLGTPSPSAAPVVGDIPAPIMDELLADAAERSGVDPEDIEVVKAENVTWNDGSLGCPEPGMSYTMALIDGYHVILDAAGDELDYRVAAGGRFKLCEAREL